MAPGLAPPPPFEELLAIEPRGELDWTIRLRGFEGRSFGGQTLGCALRAAAESCSGRALHAFHTCFLRAVPPEVPVALRVEPVSDGRRLARRRVEVRGGDRLLCEVMASFAAPAEGTEIPAAPMDAVPAPDALPSDEALAEEEGWDELDPLAFRWVDLPWRIDGPAASSRYRVWVRPREPLPDAPVRFGALAYLSDFHSHFPVARRLGGGFEAGGFVSLDQSLWLHRDLPWEDWWLLTSECDVAHRGRALTRRSLHAPDGSLVASMAQEALVPRAEEVAEPA